jgi:hypothetical protein
VIATAELSGAFDRGDVGRFLDHTQETDITSRIAADVAQLLLGEVVALGTGAHPFPQCDERLGQTLPLRARLAQQVVGQAERRFLADSRQSSELGGQFVNRSHKTRSSFRLGGEAV